MHIVEVGQKGQITLPAELRRRLKIGAGAVLEAEARPEGILLRPAAPIKGGEAVGEEFYSEVIKELEELRREWR